MYENMDKDQYMNFLNSIINHPELDDWGKFLELTRQSISVLEIKEDEYLEIILALLLCVYNLSDTEFHPHEIIKAAKEIVDEKRKSDE